MFKSKLKAYYKVRQLFYYKVRQVLLQSATVLLQSATGITKCDDYYKVRQNNVTQRKAVEVTLAPCRVGACARFSGTDVSLTIVT